VVVIATRDSAAACDDKTRERHETAQEVVPSPMRRSPFAACQARKATASTPPPILLLPTTTTAPGDQLLLGRSRTARIRFADPRISRRHAVLHRTDDGWLVADLASTHGTRVNGRPVVSARSLADGDLITLGPDTAITVRF
jgi:FHA domain